MYVWYAKAMAKEKRDAYEADEVIEKNGLRPLLGKIFIQLGV
jgi:hypothetical protein